VAREFNVDNVRAYLAERGLLAADIPALVEPLGGGVSNRVIKVVAADRRYVVKQSLPVLRVRSTWTADRGRILNEAAAMRELAHLLPAGAVPVVHDVDPANFVLVMACAPDGAIDWKAELRAGEVDLAGVSRCAELLAELHGRTRPSTPGSPVSASE